MEVKLKLLGVLGNQSTRREGKQFHQNSIGTTTAAVGILKARLIVLLMTCSLMFYVSAGGEKLKGN